MEILVLYRKLLLEDAAIAAIVDNRIYVDQVPQNTQKPNILLEMPDQGQDYTHSGPSGLIDAHLKVTCRADDAQGAATLGRLVVDLLEVWTGNRDGHEVDLTEHFKTSSMFHDKDKVFTHMSEYTSFFRKVS